MQFDVGVLCLYTGLIRAVALVLFLAHAVVTNAAGIASLRIVRFLVVVWYPESTLRV